MSDSEETEVKPFEIERAKQGRAKCHKCKSQCEVISSNIKTLWNKQEINFL